MTVFKDIVIGSEVNGFSTKFLKNYDIVSPTYPNGGLLNTENLITCWSDYPDKNLLKVVHFNSSQTLVVAIGSDGLLATSVINLNVDYPDFGTLTWTDRTSTLTSLAGGTRKKLNTVSVLRSINGVDTDNVLVVGGQDGFCAYTRDGTNWSTITELALTNIRKINWNKISTILLEFAVGKYKSTDPYFIFFNEIPATQSFRRGDLNNSGTITSSDALTALRYNAGLEPNAWAKTHIETYLLTNYSTLNTSLKDLVITSDQWPVEISGSNDIIDSCITGSIVSLLGASGQIAYISFSPNSASPTYYFCRINSSLKNTLPNPKGIVSSVMNSTQFQDINFSGNVYLDQGNSKIVRVNLNSDSPTTDYMSVGMSDFSKTSGTANIGGNLATVIAIIDRYNFLLHVTDGTPLTGTIVFKIFGLQIRQFISSDRPTILTGFTGTSWSDIDQTVYDKVSGAAVSLVSQGKIISSTVYNNSGSSRTNGVLIPCVSGDNTYISTNNLKDYYLCKTSNSQIMKHFNLTYTKYNSKNPTGTLQDYLIFLTTNSTGDKYDLNNFNILSSNNNIEYIEIDMSLQMSSLIEFETPKFINTIEHYSGLAGGITTQWLLIGTNTGKVLYTIVKQE